MNITDTLGPVGLSMDHLLKIIRNHGRATGRLSGITVVELVKVSGLGPVKIKALLEQALRDQTIYVREGINNVLIFPS